MNHYLAINPGAAEEEVPGEPTHDPAFGLPAVWISEEHREKAERLGYTVVDPPSIIATHLDEIIKSRAAEILGRQEVQSILDTLKEEYPAVVEEVTKTLSLGEIQKVLQSLLSEQVSIRNMIVILETLADYGNVSKDIGFLTEKARQSLSRQICLQYVDEDKHLKVMTLEPAFEQQIIESAVETAEGSIAALEPALHRKWINALSNSVKDVQDQGFTPFVFCSEAARRLVKSSTARSFPYLVVISVPEVVADVIIDVVGEIKVE